MSETHRDFFWRRLKTGKDVGEGFESSPFDIQLLRYVLDIRQLHIIVYFHFRLHIIKIRLDAIFYLLYERFRRSVKCR